MEKIVEKELSYSIIGALFDVYNEIGFGHKERMYQKALTVMLKKRNVAFKEQVKVDVVLHNEVIGKYFLDFFVEGRIIVELKANASFRVADYRQAMRYLQTMKLPLAILATFTPDGVRYRRVLNIR